MAVLALGTVIGVGAVGAEGSHRASAADSGATATALPGSPIPSPTATTLNDVTWGG
ncbi:hypothetical protein [Kitasatospora camelliae]|uniref:Uncharacterized protein n=1 Tax=Kitasatospora camelliae TaxID=3156397 RepID=A0AAU8K588_9ACTN